MQRMRIAVDMDEVLADTLEGKLAWLDATYGYRPDRARLKGSPLQQNLRAEHAAALERHLGQGEFFGSLATIPGSQDALAYISKAHDVFITTAAMEHPASMLYKWKWLAEHFSFLDPMKFVFCGDKSIVNADFLVDDSARHFEGFQGQGILFSAPHNLGVDDFPRLEKWGDAERLLTCLYKS